MREASSIEDPIPELHTIKARKIRGKGSWDRSKAAAKCSAI